ncbi:MAG: GNAT family N-acetyltransferase [Pyrinomonadaceae bacterium]
MPSSPANIVIRDIETLPEIRAVEQLQRDIWGVSDLDVFPALALIPMKEVGAILIGAFANGQLVGFVFGFPGVTNGRPFIHSDMLGVTKSYRSLGLGYLLKLEQRKRALDMGMDHITWTFDPLQSVNAHFNFARLGVIADRYEVDYYGETSSHLHQFGTDRLWVTWRLDDERTQQRLQNLTRKEQPRALVGAYVVRLGADQEPSVQPPPAVPTNLLIEIPVGISEIAKDNPNLAWRWRVATRQCFSHAIASGLFVNDFVSGRTVGTYLLLKRC